MARIACIRRHLQTMVQWLASLSAYILVGVAVVVMSGCGDDREAVFDTTGEKHHDTVRKALLADIQKLAAGKDLTNPDNVVIYHKAVDDLIARGSSIENTITEALGSDNDWGVRLGAIEVLKGIGTRACIETLLGALEDPEPLVALNANYLLRALTNHSVIPEAGSPTVDGLPPVPERDPKNLDLNADEKLWAQWHQAHKVDLHRVWREWWTANKATIAIQ